MAVTLVDCAPGYLPGLRSFMERMHGERYVLLVNDDFFQWQFRPSAALDALATGYAFKLALVDDRVAGCLGYIAAEVNVGGACRRGAWVINWVVEPASRHFGVGPMLMQAVVAQFDVVLNVGASGVARMLLARMGWLDLGPLSRYVRVLDRHAAARLSAARSFEWPDVSPAGQDGTGDVSVARVPEFRADATGVWNEAWVHPGRAGARRSARFLNWRYAQHPVFDYRLFEARQNGQLAGFAVYRVERVLDLGVAVGRITELVARPGVESHLLDAISADARANAAALIDFFCSSASVADLMARNGFVTGERLAAARLPRLFHPVDQHRCTGPLFLARVAAGTSVQFDWYATSGDADQDRPN